MILTNMTNLQVSAKMKIREDMLDEIKQHANECIQRVTEKDPGTIQYDWFISSDNTECEIRETYENSEAFLAHLSNLSDLLRYSMNNLLQITLLQFTVVPQDLLEKINAIGVDTKFYSFLKGL